MTLFRSPPPSSKTADEENPYLLSFADIMAGLLVIFILALITVMIRLDRQTAQAREQAVHARQQAALARQTREQIEEALAELARIEELRKQLLEEVKRNLQELNIWVEIVDNHSILRIPEEELHFESGKYDIPADKAETVSQIGHTLADALIRSKRLSFIDTIFIEGHTDSQPLASEEMGNWGLSAHRAISVWKHWTEDPGELKIFLSMKNKNRKPLFSVSGYAETRRIVIPDLSVEDRRKNRRIDLRFTMRTPAAGDLTTLLEQFGNAGIR
ncbi:MAG: OmpA family protein [Gammaproteobacteria bacterium]|nr:OmpA family protein [Gammaproteobacteria bacterium]